MTRSEVGEIIRDTERFCRTAAENIKELTNLLTRASENIRPALVFYNRRHLADPILRNAGILPHAAIPWMQFDPDSPEDFPDVVLDHFEKNWGRLEGEFMSRVNGYNVSEEAKFAFAEALGCHTSRFYNSSVLPLFAAIEREARFRSDMSPRCRATSLKEIRDLIKTAPFSIALRLTTYPFLTEVFDTHIYEYVNTDQDIEKFSRNPIPNRHAAMHKLVKYNSRLNSLNVLIFADYVFSVLSRLPEPSAAHEMCA